MIPPRGHPSEPYTRRRRSTGLSEEILGLILGGSYCNALGTSSTSRLSTSVGTAFSRLHVIRVQAFGNVHCGLRSFWRDPGLNPLVGRGWRLFYIFWLRSDPIFLFYATLSYQGRSHQPLHRTFNKEHPLGQFHVDHVTWSFSVRVSRY